MTEKRFQQIIADALDSLPNKFREAMANIAVVVEDWPDEDILAHMGIDSKNDLFGLYHGTPLPERNHEDGAMLLPDVITLYRRPLEHACRTESELRREIRITLLHEIGHYFGLDEERLGELGYD
jgi:predicted Zn-dependent protease with MMP-like domain